MADQFVPEAATFPMPAVVAGPTLPHSAKAYRDLERAGLVAPPAGQGTFVVGSIDQVPAATYARLSRSLRGWLSSAHDAGLNHDQVRALVTAALDDDQTQAGAA